MTNLRNSISPWLAALGTLMLVGACASNAPNSPTPKSASDESAAGPDHGSSDAKSSETSKTDVDDETDEVTTPSKGKESSGDAKEKSGKGGAAPVDDSRTTEAIHQIIKDNRKTFKKCYEDEHKKAPDLKGTVMLKLTLDAEGKIKSAGIDEDETTIKVKAVSDCIIKIAQTLTYPPSSKGLDKDFHYKFGFNNIQ